MIYCPNCLTTTKKLLPLRPNWIMQTGRINILFKIVLCFIALVGVNEVKGDPAKKFTVVIDAGHGGHDPGAIGRRGKEKNINLKVALKLGQYIQNNCSDTRVIYTRKNDTFIPLYRRAEIANEAKANLFISIHTNSIASRSTRVSGSETYTLGLYKTEENLEVAKKENAVILIEDDYRQRYAGFNPNSSESYIIFEFMQDKYMAQSVNFAKMIQRQFRSSGRLDKGVHQAGFLVLRETSMPSVLVELGYISNPVEENYLLSESGSTTLAKSIYNAFVSYKKQQGYRASAPLEAIPETPAEEPQESTPQQPDTETDTIAEATGLPTVSGQAAEVAEASTPDTKRRQSNGRPVFKIQILTSGTVLPAGNKRFKGLSPVRHYKENGIVKYTYGEDTDYNRILRLKRNQVDAKFRDAFIIAFKDGEKMDINQAIKEFKNNR